MQTPLVSVEWLYKNLDDPDLIVLDAVMDDNGLLTEGEQQHLKIKGARIFDINNKFSATDTELPHMLQSEEEFTKACRELGINANHKIVVYDRVGIYTSPRVWWMFKTMGHENVSVLDGGLPAWLEQKYKCELIKDIVYPVGDFTAKLNTAMVMDIKSIENNLTDKKFLLLDARSGGRFRGVEPEPREKLKGGHIPNSLNLFYEDVLENGKYKSKDNLKLLFEKLEIGNSDLAFTCGSGITACIILLAAELVCENNKSVYDGSWTEWGAGSDNNPVEN